YIFMLNMGQNRRGGTRKGDLQRLGGGVSELFSLEFNISPLFKILDISLSQNHIAGDKNWFYISLGYISTLQFIVFSFFFYLLLLQGQNMRGVAQKTHT
ncbi:hypothetical protein ACJX0J_013538, partial [Zea mays]